MKKIFFSLSGLIIIFIIFKLFLFSTTKKNESDKDYRTAFRKNYKIFSVEIPEKIDFAEEDTPLNLFYVRESLDRELIVNTYWHSSTLLLFKRAYRWFPIIEPILKENEVPDDFKYLALIESSFINAVSPKNAVGFWQFLKDTGKTYGLEINNEVDERYNVEKSTKAACEYLKEAYENYKNWTLVAASYNAGKRRINQALDKQKITDYYSLFLNDETSRYIFRILAIKTIFENPTNYGFYLREKDFYPVIPTKEITINYSIPDLVNFAHKHKINYKILKYFNPWLRTDHLTNKAKKTYSIKIPKEGYLRHKKLLKQIKDDNLIFNDTLTVEEIN